MPIDRKDISFLRAHSAYAVRWLNAYPQWEEWLLSVQEKAIDEHVVNDVLSQALACDSLDALMRELRLARQRFMLLLAFRDLSGLASLVEVTQGISLFGERAIEVAVEAIRNDMKNTVGEPVGPDGQYSPPIIVGMGKLGGRELNVSSDIDLVFIYEDEGETQGGSRSISYHEWYARLGKKLIGVLSEITAEGFVFRVDMRLRPNGDSGPLVCSLAMLEEYFSVQGREWERYAWIKGRMVYPSQRQPSHTRLGKELSDLVRPFVFRRYLDFGVIAAIRDIHAQIQQEAEKRSLSHPERAADIKLGRGGIREIEFMAQMFQLIRGGQDPSLRIRPTLDVLAVVNEQGLISQTDYLQLCQAYDYFRKLEHRLQYWEDAQTHHLPSDDGSQLRLAQAMGHHSLDEFRPLLAQHRANVARLFADAFVLKSSGEDAPLDEGYWTPGEQWPSLKGRWDAWLSSARQRSLTDSARRQFMLLMARAAKYLEAEGVGVDRAEQILQKYMDLLEAISRRASYLSLLTEYPHILSSLMALLESSRWGADYLIKHPHLLDELLTGPGQYSPEDHPQVYWTKLRAQINAQLDDALEQGEHDDVMMDILRQTHHTETFLTLLAELGIGRNEPLVIERVSDRLSALADLILDITLERVWSVVAKRYKISDGLPPRFAIIAYGKLGGKELGYASDLDIVFLYDADESDQEAGERYSNLARKLIFWLTTATASGILFEIDTRLRPNGVAGLLVTSIQAFERYQMREGDNSAWVWEHQALTRARFCAGDRLIGDRFEKIRQQVLSSNRDPKVLREEIILMRKRVADGHPNATDSFDVKHDQGGMVDIEFIVQYLILQYASEHPALLGNLGNIALLHIAGQIGLIDVALADKVAKAYRLYREYQHLMRLDGAEKTRIFADNIDESLKKARESVSELWRFVLGAE